MFSAMRNWLTSNLDWFFIAPATSSWWSCSAGGVAAGQVRLGGTEATPDYTYLGWFSMLFAAGMGIGLMFFGVSEPLSHFGSAFGGTAVEKRRAHRLGAARWRGGRRRGRDPARHGGDDLPLGAASVGDLRHHRARAGAVLLQQGPAADHPLGVLSRCWRAHLGLAGHVIDILAVLATLFGLATSLGYGASQASSGLNFLFDVPLGNTTQIVLVIGITAIALFSVVAGLDAASSACPRST